MISQKIKKLSKYDILILCGGLGTRFRSISTHYPKPLARIGRKRFLDLLLDKLLQQGFRRFILCLGFMGNYIKNYYLHSPYSENLVYSHEKIKLGTAGAIKNAQKFIRSNPFIVINGDSFCDLVFDLFINFHLYRKNPSVSMVVAEGKSNSEGGSVTLDKDSLITSFSEKEMKIKQKKLINAGVYIFNNKILSMIPSSSNYSLEYSLFPQLTGKGFYGYFVQSKVFDIGTPDGYNEALKYLI